MQPTPMTGPAGEDLPPEMRRARILIVDNERPILSMLTRVLTTAGFEKVEALSDSVEALDQLRGSVPDLLVLDLHMHSPDGFTILEQLEGREAGAEPVAVLIVTGDPSFDTKRRTLIAPLRDLLNKPFEPRELVLRAEYLLTALLQHRQDRRILSDLGSQLTLAKRELNVAHIEAVQRLRAVADSYAPDAAHHHLRVAELSELVAQKMALPKGASVLIRQAALLHDLGKAVPAAAATAAAAVAAHHTLRGAELLAQARSPYLRTARQIALSHHEHWDGSGVPQGLAAASIPLAARIVAVVNDFDHLTHPDAGTAPLPRGDAFARIQEHAGSRYDPAVVDALRDVLPAIHGDLGGSYVRR
jgi:putative two-component system response regulator